MNDKKKTKLPTETMTLRDVEVLRTPFRNFSGSPTKFNPEGGQRFFNIRLEEGQAQELARAGWRVKELPPKEDGDEPLWLFEVKVSYKGRPPRVVKVTPGGKAPLDEEVVGTLDSADIEFANIIVRPYDWGGDHPTAYLQTGFFHIKLDELELMYEMEMEDEVVCDEDGVCYLNGVRIN